MNGYIANIEHETESNENFRKVLYTDERLQLVVMHLRPNEDIGEEVHALDQFIRIKDGSARVVLNGEQQEISDESVVIIPAGTKHNIINTSSDQPLKLYTLYAPPEHAQGTIHTTKADAEAAEHH